MSHPSSLIKQRLYATDATHACAAAVRQYFSCTSRLVRFLLLGISLVICCSFAAFLLRSDTDAEASLLPLPGRGSAVRLRASHDQVIATDVDTARFDSRGLLAMAACELNAPRQGACAPENASLTTRRQASFHPVQWQNKDLADPGMTGNIVSREGLRAFLATQGGLLGQTASLPLQASIPRAYSSLPFEPATDALFSLSAKKPVQEPLSFHPEATRVCRINLNMQGNTALFRNFSIFKNHGNNYARAGMYRAHVVQYAKKYHLSEELVFAIVQAESNFNPLAVSPMQAVGLMQIVPDTAGGEAHAYLTGLTGIPGTEALFQPEKNIQYGTTYLHLLSTRYFQNVLNSRSRQLCIIAAYNGGPGAVLRVFAPEHQVAVERINTLTPDEVYTALTTQMPKMESRQYVDKVLGFMRDFTMSSL